MFIDLKIMESKNAITHLLWDANIVYLCSKFNILVNLTSVILFFFSQFYGNTETMKPKLVEIILYDFT